MPYLPIKDGDFPVGLDASEVVALPPDVVRWKLRLRQGELPLLYLKKKDGSFEQWFVEWDVTHTKLKPWYCTDRNVLRIVFK